MIIYLHKNQQGVTLLETMLALAIAVSLIIFGLRAYDQLQFHAKEQQIANNVNILFQALSGFYYANCRQTLDANSVAQSTGALDPIVTDNPVIPASYPISIQTNLITPDFIHLKQWQPKNPLVDNSAPENGYSVQYNRVITQAATDPVMSIDACTGSSNPPSCDRKDGALLEKSNGSPTNQSHVVTWVSQVAVKLSDALTAQQWIQIKNDLSADCISTSTKLSDCTTSPSGSGYLIWAKMPAAYTPTTSVYWTAMPYVKQFNMQYTNDGMAALSGIKDETQDSVTKKNWYDPLNYLCGG